jgi:hypothetical protein
LSDATSTTPQFLTTPEVSDRYSGKISARTLNNWRNLGSGPPFTKIGGKVLYPVSKLVEWEQRNTVQSTSEYTKGNAA